MLDMSGYKIEEESDDLEKNDSQADEGLGLATEINEPLDEGNLSSRNLSVTFADFRFFSLFLSFRTRNGSFYSRTLTKH